MYISVNKSTAILSGNVCRVITTCWLILVFLYNYDFQCFQTWNHLLSFIQGEQIMIPFLTSENCWIAVMGIPYYHPLNQWFLGAIRDNLGATSDAYLIFWDYQLSKCNGWEFTYLIWLFNLRVNIHTFQWLRNPLITSLTGTLFPLI